MTSISNSDPLQPAPSLPGVTNRNSLESGPVGWAPLARHVGVALAIALAGSVILAALECGLAAIAVAEQLAGEHWPTGLVPAALGKASVTHALLWCPVLVVCALAHWLLVRRRRRAAPGASLLGVFVVLAVVVVVPADLEMIRPASATLVLLICGVAVMAGMVVYWIARWLGGRLTASAKRKLTTISPAIATLMIVVTGVSFATSPLLDPQDYRIGAGPVRDGSAARPNVLWLVLDTVRADRMSCHGYDQPTTPFLDEWAAQCVVFDLALANGVWTVPSHASMFTGLPVRQHGTDYRNTWLEDRIPTVADRLRGAGYATAMFSNNPWLSPDTNLNKGFDTCAVVYHLRHVTRFSLEFLGEKFGITPPLPWLDGDFGAALTNQWVGQWLDRHAYGDQPFFAYVNYLDAHLPYRVPERYRRMFLTEEEVHRSYDLRQKVYGNIVTVLDVKFNIDGPDRVDPADRRIMHGLYLAAIRYLDDRVRELIDSLRQRGLLDNTLVVVLSDHGENLDHHGMWGHRFLAYNSLAHASLLLHRPGQEGGRRVSVPVQLSDLCPTVVNAALDPPGPGDDDPRDLFRVTNDADAGRVAVIEYNTPEVKTVEAFKKRGRPESLHRIEPQIAACDGRFKYIASGDGRRELYDLAADPGEEHDLIAALPEEAHRLAAHIDQWLERTPVYEPTRPGAAPPMPPEVVEALRSLGYVDDD